MHIALADLLDAEEDEMPLLRDPDRISKHHPLGDARTGADAAALYGSSHPPRGNGGLRQLSRFLRIKAGARPLKYDVPTNRERKTQARIDAYGGGKTTKNECVWFSPACVKPEPAKPSRGSK